jgi:hypothetical protein
VAVRCLPTESRRRQVLEHVVDIVKVIGKRGLSYSGMQSEAVYTLEDASMDHSHFLVVIIQLGIIQSA